MYMIRVIIQDRFCFLKEGIMDRKYNAFISYRHAPEDIKIASEVQTQLERFKIPKEIQKKTGVKRFERVFRDKEELPITSDLNDDIDLALENSDHLIVICSERTGESIWVQKEIETFLKYHSKKDIFTVLVDGEPGDVIPEILLHDTVTRKLADGTEETREELIEPLSCDYRIGIKKARKTELPRLAASMLRCSYDELVQRRKQYVRRRIAMIAGAASIMAAFAIGYLIWSLFQIQKNYDLAQFNYELAQENYAMAQANYVTAEQNFQDSLRNQSRYLASESRELLANDDRLGAVQLALAALPSEGNDRPVTSEAEYALANALGAYMTPGLSDTDAIWKYGTGIPIRKYRVDENYYRVAVHDSERNLMIWSLVDHSLVKAFKEEGHDLNDYIFDAKGRVIIAYSDELRVYDTDLETVLWSLPLDEVHKNSTADNMLRALADPADLLYYTDNVMMIIDLETGKVKEDHILSEEIVLSEDSFFGSITVLEARISPDASLIAVEGIINVTERMIFIYDRNNGEWSAIPDVFAYVGELAFSPDSSKMIVSYEEDVYLNSFSMMGLEVLTETIRYNSAYDVHTGELLWTSEIPHTLVGYGTGISFVKCGTGEDQKDAVAISFSNKCQVVELETGEVRAVKELPSEYIDSYVTVSGTGVIFILRDGQYLNMNLKDPDSSMTSSDYFKDHVEDSLVVYFRDGNNHFLIMYNDNGYITEYSTQYYDKDFRTVKGCGSASALASFVSGDMLLVLTKENIIYCVDMPTAEIVWKIRVDGDFIYDVEFLCDDADGNVYFKNMNRTPETEYGGIYRIDMKKGLMSLLIESENHYNFNSCVVGEKIFYTFKSYDSSGEYIGIYDTSSDTLDKVSIIGDIPSSLQSFEIYVSPDEKYAVLSNPMSNQFAAYYVELDTGESWNLKVESTAFASWSPDSSQYAVATTSGVVVYKPGSGEVYRLNDFESEILDICFCDKGLIVLQTSGMTALYDKEGKLISSLDAFMGVSMSKGNTYEMTWFEFVGDTLFLTTDTYTIVIDMNEFKVRNLMAGFLGGSEEAGRYYFKVYFPNEEYGSFGYIKIKSIEELIAEGREFVGDEVMSYEMRNKYGIG